MLFRSITLPVGKNGLGFRHHERACANPVVALLKAVLQIVQPRVETALRAQLVVATLFPNLALVNDQIPIRMLDRRQTMGDDQRGAVFQKLIQRLLN